MNVGLVENEIRGVINVVNEEIVYPVVVDYDVRVEEILKNRNSWVNRNITTVNFPVPAPKRGKHEVMVELVCFEREISTEQATEKIEHQGLQPIDVYELFHLIDRYPDIPFSVVALGSMSKNPDKDPDSDDYLIPYFCRFDPERSRVRLGPSDVNWDSYYRFGAVRK